MTVVYGLINNLVGLFMGVGAAPPLGSVTATIAATMTAAEIHDASNYLRLGVYADFGAGPKFMAWGPPWQGGPSQVAPSFVWTLPQVLPQAVFACVQNGMNGATSPALINGLTITFA